MLTYLAIGFYINLPLGAIVLGGLVFVNIPNQQPVPPAREAFKNLHHRLDLIGFVIFAGGAVQLLLALQWGGSTYEWDSATIIGLFCGAGASFLLYVAWSWHRGDDALLPPKLFKLRIVLACSLLTLFMMGGQFTVTYWLPVYFQTVRGATPILSGVHLLPNILATVLFGICGGVLSKSLDGITSRIFKLIENSSQ